jgi:hypothetical protein
MKHPPVDAWQLNISGGAAELARTPIIDAESKKGPIF